jgi:tetratricopeptide (TPR) repeat protein
MNHISVNSLLLCVLILFVSAPASALHSVDSQWEEKNKIVVEHFKRGDYKRALKLARSLLLYAEKHPDPDRYNLSSSFNNLGMIQLKLGNYEASESAFNTALDIRIKEYGESTPIVALTLNNLGGVLQKMQRHQESENYFRKSLIIKRKNGDISSESYAKTLDNIGLSLMYQKRYDEAEEFMRQALNAREGIFNLDHPAIAYSYVNIASLRRHKKEFEGVESLYQHAYRIFSKHLGKNHPITKKVLKNTVSFYKQTRKEEDAIELATALLKQTTHE